MFKGKIILNGTNEDVLGLNLNQNCGMKKKGYLLDTHILVWYLLDRAKLQKDIAFDFPDFHFDWLAFHWKECATVCEKNP